MNSVVSYTNSSVRNLAVFDLNRSSSQHAKSVARKLGVSVHLLSFSQPSHRNDVAG